MISALAVVAIVVASIAAYGLIGLWVAVRWHVMQWRRYYVAKGHHDALQEARPKRPYDYVSSYDAPREPDTDFQVLVGLFWPAGIWILFGALIFVRLDKDLHQEYEFARERRRLVEQAKKELENE